MQAASQLSPHGHLSLTTMHDDICTLEEEKHSSIIIPPFHKLQSVDDAGNLSIRNVNQRVLDSAPCSVVILVDRSLTAENVAGKSSLCTKRRIVLLFFGSPDNQEALYYDWRMAEFPAVTLTLVRFVPGKQVAAAAPSMLSPMSFSVTNEQLQHSSVIDIGKFEADTSQIPDEEYVNEIRTRNLGNESIEYVEGMVNNSEEMTAMIRAMDNTFDLCIVWRSQGVSPMTAGLTEWMECPGLGSVGDPLALTGIREGMSVLVVQQYSAHEVESKLY
ncbi:uncharacterized protein A4U43_C09F15280 [Asparagus officinalis]|uniref:Cation/H+ exchanger domain-containing protein n=1 Tax=Asparagus officinalis TaxID=4686 RepID=A0A5P1E7J6_ASPOF|nr:uncharacterized protein A4U43_C09F15280 [Asparagus officinalis]